MFPLFVANDFSENRIKYMNKMYLSVFYFYSSLLLIYEIFSI